MPDVGGEESLWLWVSEIVEAGFKLSMRYNADYGGYSVTVTDVLTDEKIHYGLSSWGGTLFDALTDAYIMVEMIAERSDFTLVPEEVKSLDKTLAQHLREYMNQTGMTASDYKDKGGTQPRK